jgi:GMP synthase (glutamine-hydrolysing)
VDTIAILDFGSQTSQLIARRVRESHVYCELFPHDAPVSEVMALDPKGYILSGGPASVYEPDAPQIPEYVLESNLPVLGICYGMQAMAHSLGGRVAKADAREYGQAQIEVPPDSGLIPGGAQPVWMSHADRIEALPEGFSALATSANSPFAAMGKSTSGLYGLQFHPEVRHTPSGSEILRRFVVDICGAAPEWTPDAIIPVAVAEIQEQVGDGFAIAAVSGGVDSAVASALAQRALGGRLTAVFIDTGLLRHAEAKLVSRSLGPLLGDQLHTLDASAKFLESLQGVTDPEEKRRLIGEQFIRRFEEHARNVGEPQYLVQGTIYPDVVESSGPGRRVAARIKTHHNVGGLPGDMAFALVEPLKYLFKDEVRAVGAELGLPQSILMRQPFPGPGLAVRCLGEVTETRLKTLRTADQIVMAELEAAGLSISQAFAALLPVRSVGVMGDQRTYAETVVIRAVTTDDFMTADWARLPYQLLARMSSRIVNEVAGANRVVYDITSKPPGTIEWE